MAQMSIERQMEAIAFFQNEYTEPVAMCNVKSHTLKLSNLGYSSTYQLEKLTELGFLATIFVADEWDGFYGLETHIQEM